MPRKPNEQRVKAKAIFFEKRGKISPKEIAAQIGAAPAQVRKWKYDGKWDDELKKPRRGGQAGNQNAAGHGAPAGNTNAETHGAYSTPRLERLSEEQRREIEETRESFGGNALALLKSLRAKRADLEQRIAELQGLPEDKATLLDRTMTMTLPGNAKMEYINRSTPFSRRMVLEAELNRLDGRIIKLLDSIKGLEAERERLELERERL